MAAVRVRRDFSKYLLDVFITASHETRMLRVLFHIISMVALFAVSYHDFSRISGLETEMRDLFAKHHKIRTVTIELTLPI